MSGIYFDFQFRPVITMRVLSLLQAQELDSGAAADAGKFASEALLLCLHLDEHGQDVALQIVFEEMVHQPDHILDAFLRCEKACLLGIRYTQSRRCDACPCCKDVKYRGTGALLPVRVI